MIKVCFRLPGEIAQIVALPVMPRKDEFVRYEDQHYRVTRVTHNLDFDRYVPADVVLVKCDDPDLM